MQNRYKKSLLLDFAMGLGTPLIAFKTLLIRPRLWLATLIPWLISGTLAWFLMSQAVLLGAWILATVAGWLGISAATGAGHLIALVLGWVVTAIAWVAGALLMTWLSAIVALPFADWLAELAERYSEPPLAPATQLSGWFTRAHLRRFKIDLFKTAAGAIWSLAGLVLSAVPVLGILGACLLALGLSFQFLSYPQTRRAMGLGASITYLVRELPACLGFGLVLLAGFAIPFFSAFIFPLAVIGGTQLFGRLEGRRLGEAENTKAPGH